MWDVSSVFDRLSDVKDAATVKIATEMKITGEEVRKKVLSLRSAYMREPMPEAVEIGCWS